MHIDVISDVICPWCYIGKRKLDRALKEVDGEFVVTVQWRTYQLNPSIPKDGLDRQESLRKKFGSTSKAAAIYENIRAAGEVEGINFRFDGIERTPNTIDAHRVINWARNQKLGIELEQEIRQEECEEENRKDESPEGKIQESIQHLLVEELFKLYFEQGKDLGDKQVLSDACRKVGMDYRRVTELLDGPDDIDLIDKEYQLARNMGVSGVPCFIINNQYMLMGAQDPERLARAFRKIAAEEQRAERDGAAVVQREYGCL